MTNSSSSYNCGGNALNQMRSIFFQSFWTEEVCLGISIKMIGREKNEVKAINESSLFQAAVRLQNNV